MGTQRLKADYIYSLAEQPFYPGALVDLLKMSLYHLYRVYASSKIAESEKEYFLQSFLEIRFLSPRHWNFMSKNTYKLLPLLTFYALPMMVKKGLVKSIVRVDLRSILHRWFHF